MATTITCPADHASTPEVVRCGDCQLDDPEQSATKAALTLYATPLCGADRQQAQGLDGAVQAILAQPFGRFLLTAVALGFVAFGLFAMLQSRYHRMQPSCTTCTDVPDR